MLRKAILALPVLALAGCEPPPPSQAELAVRNACYDGDTQACVALEQIRAQKMQAAAAMAQAYRPVQVQMPPQMQGTRQGRTVCRNSFGQVVCQQY